ncbi:MAG: hypothetical protein IKB08_01555 [Clostridia bacterium]|nr:hypothetical protein [Clostridia bacterium]
MNKTLKKTLAIILAVLMLSASAVIALASEKNVVIEMNDSYGDGWNGNTIVISEYINGEFQNSQRITIDHGSYDIAELKLSASSSYVYEWEAGQYHEECAFRITIDGITVIEVEEYNASDINKILYIDCKHDIENAVCSHCGYSCDTAPTHLFSAQTGTCFCGIECTHEFVITGYCKICGIECTHKTYGDIAYTPIFGSGTDGIVLSENAYALFDGDDNTKWCGHYYENDLPYAIFSYALPVKLVSYTLTTANDTMEYTNRTWTAWTVYGSDSADGEWTVLHDVTDAELSLDPFSVSETFEVNADTAYKYYKIVVNMNGGEYYEENLHQMAEFTPVIDPASYKGCLDCGQEYKEPEEEETTEPDGSEDGSEDTAEICSFCGKAHANLIEEIICLFIEFFHLVKEAFRISL